MHLNCLNYFTNQFKNIENHHQIMPNSSPKILAHAAPGGLHGAMFLCLPLMFVRWAERIKSKRLPTLKYDLTISDSNQTELANDRGRVRSCI
jgi:hypothetical protein